MSDIDLVSGSGWAGAPLPCPRFDTTGFSVHAGAKPAASEPAQSCDDASSGSAEPIGRGERDSLQAYLQEIGKTPLLSPDEEIALGERIRRGDNAAREHMVQANLRLVVKIAKDYRHFGLPLLDLISAGNIGLIRAVERFDPRKGGKLSSYAGWWIRQSVRRALADEGRTIRLPMHVVERLAKLRRLGTELTDRLGREPTDEELAAELQIPTSKVAHLKSLSSGPASLDAPVGEEGARVTLGEMVGDANAASPYETLRRKNVAANLQTLVDTLDPREAEIIKLRFGLQGRDELTLEETGQRFRITRERIRQLEHHALLKLRKAMARREAIRTAEEIEQENRDRQRMAIIREFIDSRVETRAHRREPVAMEESSPALQRAFTRKTAA